MAKIKEPKNKEYNKTYEVWGTDDFGFDLLRTYSKKKDAYKHLEKIKDGFILLIEEEKIAVKK